MSFPFPLYIRITPPATRLFFCQHLLPLPVQTEVDPAEDITQNELHNQNDHNRSFSRDVCRGVLWLKDLRADDVAHAKRCHCHRIYRHLLTCQKASDERERGGGSGTDLFGVTARVTGVIGIDDRQGATERPSQV